MQSEMNKTDLTDVTFIVPLRIDSEVRKENLEMVISFLQTNLNTTIMVLEADKDEKYLPADGVLKTFIKDEDPVFHHSKYRNVLIRKAVTEYICLWDADAIGPVNQIIAARDMLRDKKADLVFPYDGKYYNVPGVIKNVYKEMPDVEVFLKNIDKLRLMHGIHSVGGAIMINREVYMKAGMENEKFYGWSPEDYERIIRCEILGYRIARVDGPLFHLEHARGKNSWFFSDETNIKARKEFLNVCRMNPEELWEYVNEGMKIMKE